MTEVLQANWILLVLALLIGVAVAWWIFVASRRTTVQRDTKADEGPAKRNQALIDAPPAANRDARLDEIAAQNLARDVQDQQAAISAASPGAVSAAANSDAIAAAGAIADSEAGPSGAGGDDLSRIKGVGPKLVALLHQQGVSRFTQIAAWDDAEIDRIDAQMGRFQGRIRRDSWVEQAKMLAAGDMAAYQQKFGRTE